MAVIFDDIVAQASALPLQDRARLAHQLLKSLNESEHGDPEEVERLWAIEIERRMDAFSRGEVETIDADEAFARARAHLKK